MKNIFVVLFALFLSTLSYGSDDKIGAYERLGEYVPLDLVYTNEYGETKTLGEFIGNVPAVISVNYFNCPGICGPQIDGLTKSLDRITMIEGKEYKPLTISFLTTDLPKDAKDFKDNHINIIRKDFDKKAWNFLTTDNQKTIDALTAALGYEYKKVISKQGLTDYIHPSGLVVLAPDGKITRYLNGIRYTPFDLKMAFYEASRGEVRPTIARALAFCFSFDPENSKYVLATNKIFATLMLIFVVGLFIYLSRNKKNNKQGDELNE